MRLRKAKHVSGRKARFFRLALSARTIRRHLHASGWRWARPRLDVATHAPRGQRKEDPAAPLKLRLIERALSSAASVLDLDECDLHLLPVVRAMWMKGPRLRIPRPARTPSGPSSGRWTPGPEPCTS